MIAEYKNVAVIGAGTMGNGIAHVFAQFGYNVNLIDLSQDALDRALKTISKNLDRQIKKGIVQENEKQNILDRIQTHTSVENAVQDRNLIIEAIVENYEIKAKLFAEINKFAPENAIIASNTSSISITKLAKASGRPEKFIGMHFMNPVPVMKLVEIIEGYDTQKEITETIVKITEDLQKVPVVVKDYPGFVANRILMPMINEAIYTLYEGVATKEAIDTVMKLGMNHPMGPLQLADFIGLDVCLAILNVLYEGFGNPKYAPCPLLVNMVNAGHLGRKTGRGFYDYTKK